jgi:hypothetical protein
MATERRRIATRQSPKGSGKEVKIHDDLHSALLHEVVEQMNFVEIPITRELIAVGSAATARVAIGSWQWDTWIRSVRFTNETGSAFSDADTDIFLKFADADDADIPGGPSSATTLLSLEGFATGNFPAETAIWGTDFVDSTNVDAKSGKDSGILVPGGKILYAEFVNNEAGAASLGVQVSFSPFDYLSLNPQNLQSKPHRVSRDFHRVSRGLR